MRTTFLGFTSAAVALSSAILLGGCHQGATLSDNMTLSLQLFGSTENEIHTPYVAGTTVDITVFTGNDETGKSFAFVSDDPDVLSVDAIDPTIAGLAHCTAKGSGTTRLHVFTNNQEIASTDIEVAMPTRALLSPAGPAFIGQPTPFDVRTTTEVLTGGTATYQVQYFNGETRLFGNGVLAVDASGDLAASAQTNFFVRNEWLQVTPATVGSQTVALSAHGVSLGSVTVKSVDASAITQVSVEAESADGASNGDTLAVLAQSFDGSGEPVFGVDYTWNLADVEATGEGDLFEFPLDGSASNVVKATFDGHTDQTSIEADANTGFVSSSNDIGCAVRPGETRPASLGVTVAIAALALACARRRRSATSDSLC